MFRKNKQHGGTPRILITAVMIQITPHVVRGQERSWSFTQIVNLGIIQENGLIFKIWCEKVRSPGAAHQYPRCFGHQLSCCANLLAFEEFQTQHFHGQVEQVVLRGQKN